MFLHAGRFGRIAVDFCRRDPVRAAVVPDANVPMAEKRELMQSARESWPALEEIARWRQRDVRGLAPGGCVGDVAAGARGGRRSGPGPGAVAGPPASGAARAAAGVSGPDRGGVGG